MHNLTSEYFQNEYGSGNNNEYGSNYELSPEFEFETGMYETSNNEITQELMEVSNEAEFSGWLKSALKKGAGMATNFLNSPSGRKATSTLNSIATKTLPGFASQAGGWIGRNVGSTLGNAGMGQQLGSQIGANLGNAAGGAYQDFAKFATDAVADMAQEFEAGVSAPAVKPAIVRSASRNYPLILRVRGTLHASPARNGGAQNEFEYNEYSNEFSNEYTTDAGELNGEISHNEGTFSEMTEMELASELLNVQSEAELDQFLGGLFKKAVGTVSNFAKSGAGKALGGMLKGIAKKALPIAGGALGTFLLPGVGTAAGAALGNMAGNLFEVQLEGLSAEDREFEMAKAYVRFAGNAARRASRMPSRDPRHTARQAISHASRRYAPGLNAQQTNIYNSNNDAAPEGNWYRDGNRIIIDGI